MTYKNNVILGSLFALSVFAMPVSSAVSSSEAARLGQDLTPFGSVKAGNEAGTILPGRVGSRKPQPDMRGAVSTTSTRSRTMRCYSPSARPTWISTTNT